MREKLRPMPVGGTRQWMIENAPADYVSFVDDDDLVAGDYVARVMKVLDSPDPPDVVGFRLRYFLDGVQAGVAVHSYNAVNISAVLRERSWRKYDRQPNHLNPVRRSIALRVGYKMLDTGEDGDYATRMGKLSPRPREVFIDAYQYDYLDRSKKFFRQ